VLEAQPAAEVTWAQEEPANAGAWTFVQPRLSRTLQAIAPSKTLHYVGRDALPAPAVGCSPLHKASLDQLFKRFLA
jgi:2-oxoglutarate dehydrogenase complex dehydrogenase (E1) component-like enzyme